MSVDLALLRLNADYIKTSNTGQQWNGYRTLTADECELLDAKLSAALDNIEQVRTLCEAILMRHEAALSRLRLGPSYRELAD